MTEVLFNKLLIMGGFFFFFVGGLIGFLTLGYRGSLNNFVEGAMSGLLFYAGLVITLFLLSYVIFA